MADPLDEVAGKVRSGMTAADERLIVALGEIRMRGYRRDANGTALAFRLSDCAGIDVPRLLAAIDRTLELTDPLRNPTLGGTFLGAVGIQVREAILAELTGEPPVSRAGQDDGEERGR